LECGRTTFQKSNGRGLIPGLLQSGTPPASLATCCMNLISEVLPSLRYRIS
jgi:hypothetical protein